MRIIFFYILLSICCLSATYAQDASLRELDSLISLYHGMDDEDTNKIKICRKIAAGHYSPDSTIVWADNLMYLAQLQNNYYYVERSYRFLSWAYYYLGDIETSISYNYKGLLLADSLGKESIKAWHYYKLGGTYYEMSNYELSNNYYRQAIIIYQEIGDTTGLGNCYRTIGRNYMYQRMFDQAYDMYHKVYLLDSAKMSNVGMADDCWGLGNCYYRDFLLNYSDRDTAKLRMAINYYGKACAINKEFNQIRLWSLSYYIYALSLEVKHLDCSINRRRQVLDSMNMICNELDTSSFEYDKDIVYRQLAKANYHIASRDFAKARLVLDSLNCNYDCEQALGTEVSIFYYSFYRYYEAVGDYRQALHYKSLYDEYMLFESSVDCAISSTMTQMRMEYDKAIADKDRRMESFSSKVNWAISLILLFVAFLVFFYYKNSKHRNALDNANRSLLMQREEIESQRDTLRSKNKQITDSVNYAQTIQTAVLPKEEEMGAMFPEHFIIYRPLNTVSGDFYWITRVGGLKVLVCADCTGHGVPGGFLSMLGISILNDIFGNYRAENTAAMMLDLMRQKLMRALGQSKQKYDNGMLYSMDGIDLALVIIDDERSRLQYAGAYRPLLIWRQGEIITYKPDKMPIGLYLGAEKNFSNNIIDIQKGDVLYMFSDGMPDQFGYLDDSHQECAHFSSKRFAKMLKSIGHMPMPEQRAHVERVMEDWRNGYPQLDDNILIGIRI